MKPINLTPYIGVLILTVLICTGIWLYTEWDLKRFKASLSPVPTVENRPEGAVQPQAGLPQAAPDTPEPATEHPSPLESETEHAENEGTAISKPMSLAATHPADDVSRAGLSAESVDGTEDDTFRTGDTAEATREEYPYDREIVKAGFDDYNAYLATDPEHAYQRLDDALREQFGDHAEVDILVAHTRRLNTGTTTIASIIENLEAQHRLLVRNNYPGQQEILDSLKTYNEMRQMELEMGREIKIRSHAVIDTSRD